MTEQDLSLKAPYFEKATEQLIQEAHIYLDKTGSPLHPSDLEFESCDEWATQEYLQFGHWLSHAIAFDRESEVPLRPEIDDIQAMYGAGHCPEWQRFSNRFDMLWKYQEALGFTPDVAKGKFAHMTHEDFQALGRRLVAEVDGKPVRSDIQAAAKRGESPSVNWIQQNYGPIGKIFESSGYPDIKSWSTDDFIDWGVTVMRSSGGAIPTASMLAEFSTHKLGPGPNTIFNHFPSLVDYQQLVVERHLKTISESDLDTISVKLVDPAAQTKEQSERVPGKGISYHVDSGALSRSKQELFGTEELTEADMEFLSAIMAERGRIRNVASKIIGGYHDTEDVVAEVITRAWNARHKFNGDSKVSTWIHRITLNASSTHLGRKIRRESRASHDDESAYESLDDRSSTLYMDVDELLAAQDLLSKVQSVLSPRLYEVFILRAAGMHFPEIAEELEISETAAKVRMHRAKKLIVSVLDMSDTD